MLHVSIEKNSLFNVLSKTQSIASKRSSMPILSNVLIETGNNEIYVKATNLEVGIKLICEAEVHSEGKIALNAKSLCCVFQRTLKNGHSSRDRLEGVA